MKWQAQSVDWLLLYIYGYSKEWPQQVNQSQELTWLFPKLVSIPPIDKPVQFMRGGRKDSNSANDQVKKTRKLTMTSIHLAHTHTHIVLKLVCIKVTMPTWKRPSHVGSIRSLLIRVASAVSLEAAEDYHLILDDSYSFLSMSVVLPCCEACGKDVDGNVCKGNTLFVKASFSIIIAMPLLFMIHWMTLAKFHSL